MDTNILHISGTWTWAEAEDEGTRWLSFRNPKSIEARLKMREREREPTSISREGESLYSPVQDPIRREDPSSFFHVRMGRGKPVAVQRSLTFSPSITDTGLIFV
jgi:hypothetical protein